MSLLRLALVAPFFARTSFGLDFSGGELDSRLTLARPSSAAYVNAAGLIETVGNDMARLDHDPVSLAPLGLLTEEQRTNLEPWSEDLNHFTLQTAAGMQPVGSGPAVDQVSAPDGNTSADFIAEYPNAGKHYAFGAQPTGAATQTYSVFCKQGTRTKARIQIGAAGMSNGIYTDADFAAGTTSAAGSIGSGYGAVGSPKIAAYANGFYRTSVSATTPATAHVGYVGLENAAGATSYAGDGSGLYIWGWQLENGAFATSYIPTGASAATRAADVCTSTHADFTAWLALSDKTVVVQADSPASGARYVLEAGLAADEQNSRIIVYTDDSTVKVQVRAGGVTGAQLSLGTIAAGKPFKVALSLAADGSIEASLNGADKQVAAGAAIPGCDTLWFGCGPGGNQLCGHLSGTWRFISGIGDVEALSA